MSNPNSSANANPTLEPTSDPQETSEKSDPMVPLEDFDWKALEDRYRETMEGFVEREEKLVEEFGGWVRVSLQEGIFLLLSFVLGVFDLIFLGIVYMFGYCRFAWGFM